MKSIKEHIRLNVRIVENECTLLFYLITNSCSLKESKILLDNLSPLKQKYVLVIFLLDL